MGLAGQVHGGLLDHEDVDEIAADLDPNSSIALLVVENRWAVPFIDAVRNAGGQVLERARVPADMVNMVREDLSEEPT